MTDNDHAELAKLPHRALFMVAACGVALVVGEGPRIG